MEHNTGSYFDLNAAPISVSDVTLLVQDLDAMVAFYTRALGLNVLRKSRTEAQLGVDTTLLKLFAPGGLAQSAQNQPGLFHNAFLLPTRKDLGAWFHHARSLGLHLQAGDHGVSEALYLNDPEGNGIEVYADRATEHWYDSDRQLRIFTKRLDLGSLPKAQWRGAPAGTRVGHVHLQTTDLVAASSFWGAQGFNLMSEYPGALFWGSGGYHHQLATNIWSGANQSPRHNGLTGLANVTFFGPVEQVATLTAPSGVEITFKPKQE